MPGTATSIVFGNNLDVTDLGSGNIRVDSSIGGGIWTLLSSTTLSSAGTFDVSGISQAYDDLFVVLIGRATISAIGDTPAWRFNNDSGGNYSRQHYQSHGTSAIASDEAINATAINAGGLTGATSPANQFGLNSMFIPGYASATWAKNFWLDSFIVGAFTTGNLYMDQSAGVWNSTAGINRITVTGSAAGTLVAGSQLRIYGRSSVAAPASASAGTVWVQAPVTVSNSAALTQLFSQSIPGGTLGTTKCLRATLIGDTNNNSGGATSFRYQINWGGAAIYDCTASSPTLANNALRHPWRIEFDIAAVGNTGSQYLMGGWRGAFANASNPTAGIGSSNGTVDSGFMFGSNGPVSVDSTAAQTLSFFVALSAASPNFDIRMHHARIQVIG